VLDGVEVVDGVAADPPRRRVLGAEVERRLQVAQAVEQRVVGAVGDHRVGLDVVPSVVVADGRPEQGGLLAGPFRVEFVDGVELSRRVLHVRVGLRVGVGGGHSLSILGSPSG
jgi:hypothetical protein